LIYNKHIPGLRSGLAGMPMIYLSNDVIYLAGHV